MRFQFSTCVAVLAATTATGAAAPNPYRPSSPKHKRDVSAQLPPAPPDPEVIEIATMPLPPVTPNTDEGGCTADINPRLTGCIGQNPLLQNGNFLPDGNHVITTLNFTGAPAAPSPQSIYSGWQLIIIKVDGTTFPNGDPWKCITCGVPEEQQIGRGPMMDYPQAFHDGKRVLAGTNIVDCGPFDLASPECTPEKTHIYPIRFNVRADGSGEGGSMRELRLHPDNVHLGFNELTFHNGNLGQYAYFARLVFNPSPATGLPLSPRYDLVNVTRLFNPSIHSVYVEGDQIFVNRSAAVIGELRGFSGRGGEVTYVGPNWESCNTDVFAADLETGEVRRLTSHIEYVDPVDFSSDDQWMVVMDTRGSDRQMWIAGMRGLPPVTDLVSGGISASTRNNGNRRFFQPYIIDRWGDRGIYFGQQLNGAGDRSPGSVNDPNWNGRADPRWSPDGTSLVYYQQIVFSPACGGHNPLPCPVSTEPGEMIERVMVARFPNRKPVPFQPVAPRSDEVPWGVPYVPGSDPPVPSHLPQGNYTLKGLVSGTADVMIIEDANRTTVATVGVTYQHYSDDGVNFIDGSEEVSSYFLGTSLVHADWYSNLTATGVTYSTKKTSPGGFQVEIDLITNFMNANGTLTTIINGIEYTTPANET